MNLRQPLTKNARNVGLAALAAFLAFWPLAAKISPVQDQFDWFLQAKILAQPHDAAWHQHYEAVWRPAPNLLGEAAIATLARFVPIFHAAAFAYAVYLALFVAAAAYFVRADGRDRAYAELLGPLYAANHFFLMGFFNFALGLALFLLALGWLRRRGETMTPGGWAIFSALVTATYLSHLLAFAALGLAGVFYGVWAWRADWRRWRSFALSFAPAMACLAWYVASRTGEFSYGYEFHNLLYYIWFQVGPWAPASSYYPVTSSSAAWLNVAINAATIVAVPTVIVAGLLGRRFDWRGPWAYASAALIVIGLALPLRLYEIIRPGQRLIFAGLLLLPLAAIPKGPANPRRYYAAFAALVVLLTWNAHLWFSAATSLRDDTAVLDRLIDAHARVLNIADSHFQFREGRPYREKALDPYSFPNSVNPYRFLGYYPALKKGGYIGSLFRTGIILVKDPKSQPAVNRAASLGDPQAAGQYTQIVASGTPANLRIIESFAAPLFDTMYLRDSLLVMRRKSAE
jgi:hypothetical protein